MTEREYDNIHNEGGEGYNPYRDERERREFEQSQADARARLLTPVGQIEALNRRIHLECGSVAREWGDKEALDALQRDLYAQIDAIRAEMDAPFVATWTLEATKARREEWNARVRTGEFNESGRKGKPRVDMSKLRAAEKAQDWTFEDLKRAIDIYKVRGDV